VVFDCNVQDLGVTKALLQDSRFRGCLRSP